MPTRFVLISVPPEPLLSELSALITAVADASGAVEAARYPPHVTLRTGALVSEDAIDEWIAGFRRHLEGAPTAEIRSEGIVHSSYRSGGVLRRFIGYAVRPTPSLLALHRLLLGYDRFIKGPQPHYEPHLSIAYHDLSEEGAERARPILTRAPGSFTSECREVGLYRLVGERWREHTTIGW